MPTVPSSLAQCHSTVVLAGTAHTGRQTLPGQRVCRGPGSVAKPARDVGISSSHGEAHMAPHRLREAALDRLWTWFHELVNTNGNEPRSWLLTEASNPEGSTSHPTLNIAE